MKLNYSRRELEFFGEPINPELPTRLNRRAGGGGKGSAPPAPDYAGAAERQAKASMDVTKYQTHANRPTINTPWGTQSWEVDRNFDQAGFDAAQQAYKDSYIAPTEGYYDMRGDPEQGQERVWVRGTPGSYAMEAPDRNDFMGQEQWTMNTQLTPEAQKALDSQMAIQQGRSDTALGLMPHAQEAITTPIDYNSMQQYASAPEIANLQNAGNAPNLQTSVDTTNVPTYNSEYVQGVTNQALDYMRPEMQAQREALDAQLAAQGITPGSEAYNNAQRRFDDQQSRDQYNAVRLGMEQGNAMYRNQLAGNEQQFGQNLSAGQFGNAAMGQQNSLNLANTQFNNQNEMTSYQQRMLNTEFDNNLRNAQIAEAQMRQQQPLNNMNALVTGQQVSMPQMPQFNTAQRAQAPQYLNAANMGYQADLNAYNAQQASAGNMMGGLFSLGSAALTGGGAAGGFGSLFSL